MPRGAGRLDVRRVPAHVMERAVRDPNNLRVGATVDPLARARQYEQDGANGIYFVGTFLYCDVRCGRGEGAGLPGRRLLIHLTVPPAAAPKQARNARATEQHLLDVSRQHGRGRLNRQWNSNYQDVRGYV